MSCELTVFIDVFYTFYKTTLRSISLHFTLNKAFIQHQSVQDFYNSLITSANVNIRKKINQRVFKPVKIKRNMQPISTVQIYWQYRNYTIFCSMPWWNTNWKQVYKLQTTDKIVTLRKHPKIFTWST